MDDNQETGSPLFARCSVGKDRWFWVTYPSFGAICESPVDGGWTIRDMRPQQVTPKNKHGLRSRSDLETPHQDNCKRILHRAFTIVEQ